MNGTSSPEPKSTSEVPIAAEGKTTPLGKSTVPPTTDSNDSSLPQAQQEQQDKGETDPFPGSVSLTPLPRPDSCLITSSSTLTIDSPIPLPPTQVGPSSLPIRIDSSDDIEWEKYLQRMEEEEKYLKELIQITPSMFFLYCCLHIFWIISPFNISLSIP